MAGDHPGVAAGQVGDGRRHLGRRDQPGRQHLQPVEQPRVGVVGDPGRHVDDQRGVDRGGAHAVDPHAGRRQLDGERPGQHHQPTLRGAVGGRVRLALDPGDRGDVDDAATAGAQVRQRRPADQERAGQVDGQRPLPLVVAQVVDAPELGRARHVGHDVEPPMGLDRTRHRGLDRDPVGDVARHDRDAVGALVAQVEPDDVGAVVAEPLRHGEADARRHAGDQRDPARRGRAHGADRRWSARSPTRSTANRRLAKCHPGSPAPFGANRSA